MPMRIYLGLCPSLDAGFLRYLILSKVNASNPYLATAAWGMSIIHFLTKSIDYSKDWDQSFITIELACKEVMNYKLENCHSKYSRNHTSKSSTPLGWCNGDLGIATALFSANLLVN